MDESAAPRIPFVFALSVVVALWISAMWGVRVAIHQHAARYVEQEWNQRLTADIERGIREARCREQQRADQRRYH